MSYYALEDNAEYDRQQLSLTGYHRSLGDYFEQLWNMHHLMVLNFRTLDLAKLWYYQLSQASFVGLRKIGLFVRAVVKILIFDLHFKLMGRAVSVYWCVVLSPCLSRLKVSVDHQFKPERRLSYGD